MVFRIGYPRNVIGAGGQYSEVEYYADLPDATTCGGSIYIVRSTSGIIGFRKHAGFWRSNGNTWIYLGQGEQVDISTDQDIDGKKTFLNPVVLPEATKDIHAVNRGQMISYVQDYCEIEESYLVGVGGINAYQVVFLSGSNTIMAANAENPTHADRVMGLATESKAEGEYANIKRGGKIINDSWSLTPGAVYYLLAGGLIGTTPPAIGFVQKVGIAENEIALLVQIGEATRY